MNTEFFFGATVGLIVGVFVTLRWLAQWLRLRAWEKGLIKDHNAIMQAVRRRASFQSPIWYRVEVFRRTDGAMYAYMLYLGASSVHLEWVQGQVNSGMVFTDMRRYNPNSRQDWMTILDQIAASTQEAQNMPGSLPLPPCETAKLRRLLPGAFQTQVVQRVAHTAFFNEAQASEASGGTMLLGGKASVQALGALQLPARRTGQWVDTRDNDN